MRQITRRQALSEVLVAAAALGGVHRASTASGRSRSSFDKLRIAGIGVGNRGFDNLLALAEEEIVALCDVDQRYLDKARQQFPQARTARDYRQLFSDTRLDAVVISTPDHTHAHPAQLALERGWHVYCEKPLAHRIASVRQMATAAADSSAITQFGNQHRARPGYQRAIAWLRSGQLGPIREIHAWTDRPIWPQGQQRPDDMPPVPEYLDWNLWLGPADERPYHPAYHPLQWRGWWQFGSCALGDMGPHLLDPVMAGLDLALPERIEPVDQQGGTVESGPLASVLRFAFPQTPKGPGPVLHWYDGGNQPAAEIAKARRLPANGCVVIGDRARVFIPEMGGAPRWLSDHQPPKQSAGEDDERPSHHVEWVRACKSGGGTSSPFAFGARLTELCLLGNVALQLGRAFTWDAAAMQAPDAPEATPLLSAASRPGWE